MRRAIHFIAAAILCLLGAFAILVVGILVYTHGYKAEVQFSALADVLAHGETGKVIAALTGVPFALTCFLGPLVFGWLLERKRR